MMSLIFISNQSTHKQKIYHYWISCLTLPQVSTQANKESQKEKYISLSIIDRGNFDLYYNITVPESSYFLQH